MSPLIIFLLLSQTAPPQDYVGKVPNFSLPLNRFHQSVPQQILKGQRYADRFEKGTCFTMRSYIFSRQDGSAPVLVATTTCTPDETLRMDQVKNPPQVRLIPADAFTVDEPR
ncbi:MAG TPA: hypothetical protein VIX19_08475 [Terriglobales bacterium]